MKNMKNINNTNNYNVNDDYVKETIDTFNNVLPFSDTLDCSLDPLHTDASRTDPIEERENTETQTQTETQTETQAQTETQTQIQTQTDTETERENRSIFNDVLPFPETMHIDTMYDVVRHIPGSPYSEIEKNAVFHLDKSVHVFNEKLEQVELITDIEEARQMYLQVRIEIQNQDDNIRDDVYGVTERSRLYQYKVKIDQLVNNFYGWTDNSDKSAGWSDLDNHGILKLEKLGPAIKDFNGYGITNNVWSSDRPVREWLAQSVHCDQAWNGPYPDENIWFDFPKEETRHRYWTNEPYIRYAFEKMGLPYQHPSEYDSSNDFNSQFEEINRIKAGKVLYRTASEVDQANTEFDFAEKQANITDAFHGQFNEVDNHLWIWNNQSRRFQSYCAVENSDNNFAGKFNKILSFIKIELEDLSVLLKNKLRITVNLIFESVCSIDTSWFVLLGDKFHTTVKPVIECIKLVDFAPFDTMDIFVILSTILRALVMAYLMFSYSFNMKFILFLVSYNVRCVLLSLKNQSCIIKKKLESTYNTLSCFIKKRLKTTYKTSICFINKILESIHNTLNCLKKKILKNIYKMLSWVSGIYGPINARHVVLVIPAYHIVNYFQTPGLFGILYKDIKQLINIYAKYQVYNFFVAHTYASRYVNDQEQRKHLWTWHEQTRQNQGTYIKTRYVKTRLNNLNHKHTNCVLTRLNNTGIYGGRLTNQFYPSKHFLHTKAEDLYEPKDWWINIDNKAANTVLILNAYDTNMGKANHMTIKNFLSYDQAISPLNNVEDEKQTRKFCNGVNKSSAYLLKSQPYITQHEDIAKLNTDLLIKHQQDITQKNIVKFGLDFNRNLNMFNKKIRLNKNEQDDRSSSIYFASNRKTNIYVGKSRYYIPTSKEWNNSIYTHDNNMLKVLPSFSKTLFKLIKSYFNFYSRKLEKKIKLSSLRIRGKRLSTNRVLVSRPELKHTSDKVIITVYIYNRQKRYYLNRLKRIASLDVMDSLLPNSLKNKNIINDVVSWPSYWKLETLKNKGLQMVSKINQQTNTVSINTISTYTDNNAIVPHQVICQGATSLSCFKYYAVKSLRREILSIYIRQVINFNKSKFEQKYLQPLVNLVKTIYNKNIQFNLVDLKYLYLNSDIFSETLIIKLKNRKNNILTVLDKSLQMFTLPELDKLAIHNEIYTRNKIIQNLKVDSFTNNENLKLNQDNTHIKNNDTVDLVLSTVYRDSNLDETKDRKTFKPLQLKSYSLLAKIKKKAFNNQKKAFKNIKNIRITGVRIEVAGRLTKRNTAARSISKVRYVGNIKDMDSSYKGLPSVTKRGYEKPNLQYSILNYHVRIGSYGIKVWISSFLSRLCFAFCLLQLSAHIVKYINLVKYINIPVDYYYKIFAY